jgi:imidazolonepropionase
MLKLLQNPSQIVTVNTNGKNFKQGKEQNQLDILNEHSIIIEKEIIKDIIPNSSIKNKSKYSLVNVKDKVILPGLVECHTHSVFAGSRTKEFKLRLKGKSYEDIAKDGGGIITTVDAVRKSSLKKLIELTLPKIQYFISQGITALEIKSGYGLDFENEIKILKVIQYLNKHFPIDITPTFLGAHIFSPEYKINHEQYIDIIVNKMLPYIVKNKLTEFCDGFCETTAFSSTEIEKIFKTAKNLNLNLRLHTEQFNNIGGLETALKYHTVSVDHLEVLKNNQVEELRNSNVSAVLLPGVSFFLNYNYAPARILIDNNIPVAISTDYNPGSSNIANLNFIMSLAALKMNMTIEETISSVTINAARVLMMNDKTGSIEINKRADFSVFNTNEYSDIVYNVGKNLNIMTIKNGKVIYKTN